MKLLKLNQRERMVVALGGLVLILLFIWFAMLAPHFRAVNRLERKITAHKNSLVKVAKMDAEIKQLRLQLASVNTASKVRGKPLFSKIESITEQTGVRDQLFSMRPQPVVTQGKFKQQLVDIRLKQVTLPQLVRLLHAVEYRSGGVQVKSMKIRPRFEDRSLLDVNMVLMSLERS